MIKKILFIITGGTIAGNVAANDVTQQVQTGAEEFMAQLKSATDTIRLNWAIDVQPSVLTLFNVDSTDMNPAHWTAMASAIADSYDEFDAFIIAHGTNTMGYSAAALSFALENINKPKFGSCGSENGASTQNHCGF
jgi:L-asparaginase